MDECNNELPASRKNKYNLEATQMHNALTNIANEIKRLCNQEASMKNNKRPRLKLLKKYNTCKHIKVQKKKIKELHSHLRIVCDVSKFILYPKKELCCMLPKKDNLKVKYSMTRSERENENKFKKIIIHKNTELTNTINEGYDALFKVVQVSPYMSTLNKLKIIIFYSQQHRNMFSSEHNKCLMLEQKLRYLKTKISILENYLKSYTATSCDTPSFINLTSCRQQIYSKDWHNGIIKEKDIKLPTTIERSGNKAVLINKLREVHNKDVRPHINLLRKLLMDQCNVIQELKDISNL